MQPIQNAFSLRPCHARRLAGATLSALALAGLLAGCSREGAAPASPPATPETAAAAAPAPAAAASADATGETPDPVIPVQQDDERAQAWMRAVFRDAYDPAKSQALVELQVDGGAQHHLMSLATSHALPDGRVALVVNGMPADEHGERQTGRGSAGVLNVYLLQAAGSGWTVAERRENLASMGSDGEIGSVEWVMLGADKPGFTVSSYYTGQGQSITMVDIVELGHGVRHIGTLDLSADNDGACSPESDMCANIEGKLRVADSASPDGYADLLINFSGKRYRISENDNGETTEIPVETIRQTARYGFDGKAYKLVAGANPVAGD